MWMAMVLPDGFACAVVARVFGAAEDFERADDRVTEPVTSPSSRRLSVRLTIVTGQDAPSATLVHQGKEDLANYAYDSQELPGFAPVLVGGFLAQRVDIAARKTHRESVVS